MTPPAQLPPPGPHPGPHVADPLRQGPLDIVGQLLDASNAVFFGRAGSIPVAYKPIRGERPLWDFPDGCLAHRELASFLVDAAAGFGVVPPTVLLDGPLGRGTVQWWVTDPDLLAHAADDDDLDDDDDLAVAGDRQDRTGLDEEHPEAPEGLEETDDGMARELFVLLDPHEVGPPWLPVFTGELHDGRPVVLAHADTPELRSVAVLDAVLNNSDRKGSHLLRAPDGRLWGIDHGLTFHADPKLRTVLWGWAGDPIPDVDLARLERLRAALAVGDAAGDRSAVGSTDLGDRRDHDLRGALDELLTVPEVDALVTRVETLLRTGRHPRPQPGWPAVPWPAL